MPIFERQLPDVGFDVQGSVSVGTVTDGFLHSGALLPDSGPHHDVVRAHLDRNTHWGTDELVAILLTAASDVAGAFPNARLQVANMARQGGGDLPWSRSHNSGRDVDLAFYLLDQDGKDHPASDLLVLSPPAGTVETEGRQLHFDPERNWLLVNSLLTNPHMEVEYIFMADFLVDLMRETAARAGVSASRFKQLRRQVHQPRGALPHDDHMHVRFSCTPDDTLNGCREIRAGRVIPLPKSRAFRERLESLGKMLTGDLPTEQKANAARIAGIFQASTLAPTLAKSLESCEEPMCVEALAALTTMGSVPPWMVLEEFLQRTRDPFSFDLAMAMAAQESRNHSDRLESFLKDVRVLRAHRYPWETVRSVRVQAALALTVSEDWRLTTLQALYECLSDPDPEMQEVAGLALSAMAGGWDLTAICAPPPGSTWKACRRWLRHSGGRSKVLAKLLKAQGLSVSREISQLDDVPALLKALSMTPAISINAQIALRRILEKRIPINYWNPAAITYLWAHEWKEWRRKHR